MNNNELEEARDALASKDADAAKERDRLMGTVEQSNALLEDLRKDREELQQDRDKDREVIAEPMASGPIFPFYWGPTVWGTYHV